MGDICKIKLPIFLWNQLFQNRNKSLKIGIAIARNEKK